MRLLPGWIRGYDRAWLGADVVAGLIVWSVVTPQAVAYAQIAGLPPAAGLIAAPGAMIGYALLGHVADARRERDDGDLGALGRGRRPARGRRHGEVRRALGGARARRRRAPRRGGAAQARRPHRLRLAAGDDRLPLRARDADHGRAAPGDPRRPGRRRATSSRSSWTCSSRSATRTAGRSPWAWRASRAWWRCGGSRPRCRARSSCSGSPSSCRALLGLEDKGVDVVGALPDAVPDPSVPDVSLADLGALVPAALGVMIVGAEALGVSRALAAKDGYAIDVNRELYALGGANLLAGFSSRVRPVGWGEPDRRGGERRRPDPARHGDRRPADRPHRRVPHRPVRAAPAGDARRDRGRGRGELLRRHRAAADRARAPDGPGLRADRARGPAAARRAARPARSPRRSR